MYGLKIYMQFKYLLKHAAEGLNGVLRDHLVVYFNRSDWDNLGVY